MSNERPLHQQYHMKALDSIIPSLQNVQYHGVHNGDNVNKTSNLYYAIIWEPSGHMGAWLE